MKSIQYVHLLLLVNPYEKAYELLYGLYLILNFRLSYFSLISTLILWMLQCPMPWWSYSVLCPGGHERWWTDSAVITESSALMTVVVERALG